MFVFHSTLDVQPARNAFGWSWQNILVSQPCDNDHATILCDAWQAGVRCSTLIFQIFGKTEDGNGSDKTINNEILISISKRMALHGLEPGAFIYIADSAMVTGKNLQAIGVAVRYS